MENTIPQQLPLALKLDSNATFNNYWKSEHSIVRQLQDFIEQKSNDWFYIAAKKGQGVSHLLQACCDLANKKNRMAIYIDCHELVAMIDEQRSQKQSLNEDSIEKQALSGLEQFDIICIDHFEAVASAVKLSVAKGIKTNWEEAFFYLLFKCQQNVKCKLIFGANNTPAGLNFSLKDLSSRLLSCKIFQLKEYNDEDKIKIMQFKAEKKGLALENKAASFLLTHYSRDMNKLVSALELLDRHSLSETRKLTIPFIRKVLAL